MSLFMRFDGIDRIQPELRKEVKESIEIETSLTHWEMFVHLSMIVMEMNLTEIPS
jgi:hypothetical protein